MDTRLLEHFLRVAEFGSINRAARELGTSQPVVARALSELERDIGQRLVVRNRTGVALTAAGQLLASRAAQLLNHVDSIREELDNEPASRVVVGLPYALRKLLTYPAIEEMCRSSPKSAIRVYEGLNGFLHNMLAEGALDLAVLAAEQISHTDFDQTPLVQERLVLVRSPDLPAPPDPAPLSEITRYPCTMPGRPNMIRSLVERAVGARNLSKSIAIEGESQEICIEFIRRGLAGQAVGICSGLHQINHGLNETVLAEKLNLTWTVAVNRHRYSASVRRLKSIIERTLIAGTKSNGWPTARVVDQTFDRSLRDGG